MPEPHHFWSDGYEAEILLRFRELPNSNLILRVNCAAYLAGGLYSHQSVDVCVNDKTICSWQVTDKSWHEALIDRKFILGDIVKIVFRISNPVSPFKSGLSSDKRLLGIDVYSLVIFEQFDAESSSEKMIGAGADPISDMYMSHNAYHRAIRRASEQEFSRLLQCGVLDKLSKASLIPEHIFRKVRSEKYAYTASSCIGMFIYPTNYPLLMLLDAAKAWIKINRILLIDSGNSPTGLRDGHYGNFVQTKNAMPVWCDIGSITNNPPSLEFGLLEFARCYVIPLVMLSLQNKSTINVRQLMADNPKGISSALAESIFGDEYLETAVNESCLYRAREEALNYLDGVLAPINFSNDKGYWSDYRSVEALESAWRGDLLHNSQDSRFSKVVDLVKRSECTTFIDIGCNDGVFSLLCFREGLKGIAIDLDEHAINKLYSFVRQRPEIELAIGYGSFLDVPHAADMVLALAITHHLFISQKLTFNVIAKQLSKIANHAVITEFMPDGLGGTPQHPAPSPNPLPTEYCLDNFLKELRKYFATVEVVSYQRRTDMAWYSERILIYCEK